ncbi:receptor L domain protein, partial [Ostertagia ostertagi]
IRGNKRLCLTKELDFIYSLFTGIEVSDNKDSCQSDCIGGAVTDDYLRNMGNCAHVHGDLSISNWKGKPQTVHVLRGIKTIKGQLIINNNQGLGKFDYFSSLEKIEPLNGNQTFLVVVENNPDLTALPMPKLKGIEIKEDDPQVKLVNNPLLFNKSRTLMTAGPVTTKNLARLRTFDFASLPSDIPTRSRGAADS